MLGEFKDGTGKRQCGLIARHAREPLSGSHRVWKRLALLLAKQRLVIKSFELRGPTGHEQVNHPLGRRSMVRRMDHTMTWNTLDPRRFFMTKQIGQRDASEPHSGANEPTASVCNSKRFVNLWMIQHVPTRSGKYLKIGFCDPSSLQRTTQCLLALDGLEKGFKVPFSKTLGTFALDDLEEQGRTILNRLGENLEHVAFVIAIDENS